MLYLNNTILGSLRRIKDPRGTRLPNHWIMYSDVEEDSIMPFIVLKKISITAKPVGFGMNAGPVKTFKTEEFIADGVSRAFKLEVPIDRVISVTNDNADPEYEWTEPDYWTVDKDTNEVLIDVSAPLNSGDKLTITYTHSPDEKEMFGYLLDSSYNIIVYAKKNTQGKDDENFNLGGDKYANGKLIDYLFEQVMERMISDYSYFRRRGLVVKVTTVSEQIYDPDTRRYAKQVTIECMSNFLVERKELPITNIQGTYRISESF